jgi:catechol 2,3-dioxygenase-like lactoylglutathione lyase family enzyme
MSLAQSRPVTFVLTADRKTCEAWYAEKLELKPTHDDGFAAVYDLAGATLRITEIPGFVAGAHPVLGWMVPDIAETVKGLTARGVVFTVYEGMGQDGLGIWTSPDGKGKVAWFNDPDGNVLSLTQG